LVLCKVKTIIKINTMSVLNNKQNIEQYVKAIYEGSVSDFIGEIYFLSDGIAKVRGFSAGGAGNLVLICDKQMTRHSYGLTFNLNKKSAEILILSHEGKVCAGDIVLDLRENL